MRSYTLEGIVIKRSNFGEADKLVTVFSKSHGKVTLKAKGIRKLQSKRAGSLELFNYLKTMVVPGKGPIDVITEVEVIDTFPAWRKHLGRVNVAYQMAEIIDKLTPENQSHPRVFEILLMSFQNIHSLTGNWQEVTREWFIDIVRDLGYWSDEEQFSGDIYNFIEEIINRPLNSHKVLKRLR